MKPDEQKVEKLAIKEFAKKVVETSTKEFAKQVSEQVTNDLQKAREIQLLKTAEINEV